MNEVSNQSYGGAPRGPSRSEKRRNRRRRSKYARPLFSVAHGLLLLQVLLTFGFAVAVAAELGGVGGDVVNPTEEDPALRGLNLPGDGAPSGRRVGPPGFSQLLLWFYLFGTPAVFALQRTAFWRRTASAAKMMSYTLAGIWFSVIVVFLVLASQG
ncbi:MAG TPA: hypothetical protein VJ994_13800 [Paracoccaceae bacterium]|nr:hypothetical protein [Paracoccaceae bacterium]